MNRLGTTLLICLAVLCACSLDDIAQHLGYSKSKLYREQP